MKRVFDLSVWSPVPEHRRELLLRVKRAAKRAGFTAKVHLDREGLHVQGPKKMFDAIEEVLP